MTNTDFQFESTENIKEKQKQIDEKLNKDVNEIKGVINNIIFSNPENGYCVLNIDRDNAPNTTAVGNLNSPQEGSKYKFKGEFQEHSKYGLQFKFDDFELLLPETETGITRYLESVMHGIGPVRAQEIVDEFGEKTLQKIKEDPDILRQFNFIDQEQIDQINKDLRENSLQAEFKSSICRKGISANMASRIWATYMAMNMNPGEILEKIENNPYMLVDDVDRIGFQTADKIARGLGIEEDSNFRIQAAIKHVLKEALNEGHVYLPFNELAEEVQELLELKDLTKQDIAVLTKKLTDDKNELKRESNDVYIPKYLENEKQLARQIKILINSDYEMKVLKDVDIQECIEKEENNLKFNYAPEQRQAIKKAFKSNISIITGGPGTGKTTVINSICNIYERITNTPNNNDDELEEIFNGNFIHLASPTGKAAKRMEEQTGRKAKTIHRLLKYNPFEGGFMHGHEMPLPGPGILIVDEFSMCDLELAKHLFAAIETNSKLVLVGDVDQLPSVGAGSVLRDIINSGEVPVTKLEFNFRQANGSIIAKKANEIAKGEFPELRTKGDFHFEKVKEDEEAAKKIINTVKKLNENGKNPMEFQVLAPMYKTDSGVNNMNETIKNIINPKSKDKPELGKFRFNDKVMVIKNDYDKMVFNGDLGKVVDVDKNAKKIEVDIIDNDDPEPVIFKINEFSILKLAYATTIHKAQGSEFPIVIMALTKSHYIMLRRNLLYTGMTRAKDKLILVGNSWAVRKAIKNNKVEKRYSKLAQRIKK